MDKLTKRKVYAHLPSVVKTILIMSEGWLVGGALRDIDTGLKQPKDYDIIVPFDKWQSVVNSLKHTEHVPVLNSFGGFKYTFPGGAYSTTEITVDLWPQDLHSYIQSNGRAEYMFNLKLSALLLHEV